MSRTLSLSACLIVRDAAEDLDWCLQSLADEVDEIIVVDTGSSDATKTIARRYAKHVYSYEWQDDFSAARNFALSKARNTWIFFLDSDECLAGEKGALRRAVRGAEGIGEKALSILRREVDETGRSIGMPDNPAVRLLRRGGGLSYHDAVHEYLAYPDGTAPAAPMVPSDELFLYHRGYAPSRKRAKAQRNLAILEKAERDGARKLYLHYYLAGLYYDLGRYKDVRREAELSLTARERPPQGALDLWKNYMTSLEKLGREKELLELCERAVQEVPELPEAYVRLAVAAMNGGDFRQGEQLLLEAKAREAVFSSACPGEYDTFHAALPQVDVLLAACREKLGIVSSETERTHREEKSEEKDMEPAKQMVKPMVPQKRELPPEVAAQERAAEAFARVVPPAAKTVVLFGCGRGASGKILQQYHPGMRIYGFTAVRSDAVHAGRVLAAAFVGTPETADLEMYGLSDVDCIAYDAASCGVLTVSALRRHAAVLAADGQMVLQMPAGASAAAARVSASLQEAGFEAILNFRLEDAIVVRASRSPVTSCALQTIVGEGIVTARVRVDEPDAMLATVPGFVTRKDDAGISTKLAEQMDASIIIRQRKSYDTFENGLKTVEFLRKHHHLLLYEIDDNPIRWAEKDKDMHQLDFIGSHAVQVSTPALADVIRPYNPHVFVFENQLCALPDARDYAAEEQAHSGRVMLFFGALNREEDYGDILPALNAAFRKYGDQLQIRVLADVNFYQQLETEHKEFIADPKLYDGRFVPYDVYTHVLHTADISLLPLHDTEFNRTKSDLKFIESAAHGAVVLASPTVYERTVVDGCTGCIYHSPEEFTAKLERLIEDKRYRHAIAAAGRQYVKEHRLLSQHYLERAQAYQWLISHQKELDRELGERLEKLKEWER